jgi:hypothetical protein
MLRLPPRALFYKSVHEEDAFPRGNLTPKEQVRRLKVSEAAITIYFWKNFLVDRLWDKLLPEYGSGSFELAVITACMVAMV